MIEEIHAFGGITGVSGGIARDCTSQQNVAKLTELGLEHIIDVYPTLPPNIFYGIDDKALEQVEEKMKSYRLEPSLVESSKSAIKYLSTCQDDVLDLDAEEVTKPLQDLCKPGTDLDSYIIKYTRGYMTLRVPCTNGCEYTKSQMTPEHCEEALCFRREGYGCPHSFWLFEHVNPDEFLHNSFVKAPVFCNHGDYAYEARYVGEFNTVLDIRPSLKIKLDLIGMFSVGDTVRFNDKTWTFISMGIAVCDESIGSCTIFDEKDVKDTVAACAWECDKDYESFDDAIEECYDVWCQYGKTEISRIFDRWRNKLYGKTGPTIALDLLKAWEGGN